MVVAVCGENLDDAVCKIEQRDIERAAAQVEDKHLLVDILLVEAVGKSSCRRLVHDTLDIEACNLACILRCLTLCIIEVGRDRDDSLGDRLAEILLSVCLHLREDHCGNLLRRVVLSVDLDDSTSAGAALHGVRNGLQLRADLVVATAHEALDREDGVLRVGDSLVLCCLADDAVSVRTEAHNGRRCTVALGVNDNGRLAALKNGHSRVGCTKVDSQNLSHGLFLPSLRIACPLHVVPHSFCFTVSMISHKSDSYT